MQLRGERRKPCEEEAGGPRVWKAPVGLAGWASALVSIGSDSSRQVEVG